MDSSYLTLPEINALLKEKGYEERSLSVDLKPGTIQRTLANFHSNASRSNFWKGDTDNFTLDIPGRFDNKNDRVNFRFNFYYNKESAKLRISAIAAVMGRVKKLYLLGNTRSLVSSQEIYSDLSNLREKKVLELFPKIMKSPTLQKAKHL